MIYALLRYAQDRELASQPGYAKKTVKWILDFDESGSRFTSIVKSDREFRAAPDLSQPELVAIGAMRGKASHFLIATLGSFLGWGKDKEASMVEVCRRETLAWMFECAGKYDPTLKILAGSIMDDNVVKQILEAVAATKPSPKTTDLSTVRIGGRFPVEDTLWHPWWDAFRSSLKRKPKKGQKLFACFGTGEIIEPADTHPKLKKLSGVGLSQSHAPIVTFDKDAFQSYGLLKCANAAMGSETATAYVTALDDLLERSVIFTWRRHKPKAEKQLNRDYAKLGGTRILYWYTGSIQARTDVERENDLISISLGSVFTGQPPVDEEEERILSESRIRSIINRIKAGGYAQPIGNVRFCVLALSGAGGRVMVRDFIEGSMLNLAESTEQWFDNLSLVTYCGIPRKPLTLEQVLTAPLAPRKSDQTYLEWVAVTGAWRQALWRAALLGGKLPESAYKRSLLAHNNLVVEGSLSDEKKGARAWSLSHVRLALVKAYLIRKGVPMTPALDPEHPSSAYHCGRLLAVYDSLQRAALGDVGAGVVQRYYGGALTNPSGVFGQLSRMAQTHLAKLEGGLAYIYSERVAAVHNGIGGKGGNAPSFPSALDLDEQALFALGFWHQVAVNNKERTDASAAKKAKFGAPNDTESTKEDMNNE